MTALPAHEASTRKFEPILTGMLRLEASSACQLRCPSCPTTTGHTEAVIGKNVLRLADFAALVDANPWIGGIELSNYGEVFLNRELLGIFAHAFDRNVTLTIDNGANLNYVRDEVFDGLVRYQIAALTCSIDGANQETYARYRARGKFDRVIANIRRINELKQRYSSTVPRLIWQFIVFGHNEREIPEAKRLAAELGMKFIVKLSWDPDFSPVEDKELVRKVVGVASRREFEEKTGADYMNGICTQLWDGPQINWNGKMLGCCRNFWGDFGGNAFRDGLVESLNHEKMHYAREMLKGCAEPRDDIPCTSCDLYVKRRATSIWIRHHGPAPGANIASEVQRVWKGACVYRDRGKYREAARLARLVLQFYADHADALSLLGEAASQAGRTTAANYYFAKAEAAR